MKKTLLIIGLLSASALSAQHNFEFYNNGALVHVQAGAEIHVRGDVHMLGATGLFENNGLVRTEGNSYSDNLFQQRGTGTYRIQNTNVNTTERQFLQGSYAVRGGQAAIGVNDGSFYNLELANTQGVVYQVGAGNVADVRNQVNFSFSGVQNRIITHDVGMLGPIVNPANGVNYTSTFGIMTTTASLVPLLNNTVTLVGPMSGIDAGYVQGKLRRAIAAAGGQYGFVLGLEPAGAGAERGMQYVRFDPGVNTFDFVTAYFQSSSSNAGVTALECSGNTIDYFGGTDSGEWFFTTGGAGGGTYTVQVWPQDDNLIAASIWLVTKDNAFSGTANNCGPSPYGLARTGFVGLPGEFGVAAPTSMLPIELLDIKATGAVDHIDVTWNVASEVNLSHYELERSEDGSSFEHIANIDPTGGQNIYQSYTHHDLDVRYFQNYYYRVRSVDFDGAYDYSPVVVASLTNAEGAFDENSVALYPNPSFTDFSLSIYTSENLNLNMEVHNSLGQLVSERTFDAPAGNTALNVESSEWAPSVYYVTLRDAHSGKTVVKKFVKN